MCLTDLKQAGQRELSTVVPEESSLNPRQDEGACDSPQADAGVLIPGKCECDPIWEHGLYR